MVEETTQTNRSRSKMARPKPVYLWTVVDVLKWFRRVNSEYLDYLELFSKHEITGRALLRINDSSLQRMGITNNKDRLAIWREIVKQKLKTDIMEIRDMERIVNQHSMAKITHPKATAAAAQK
ncbi:protein aveugle-like [Musca domestica]|uniref:Protein aveugle n=1 Tax=Musca domestica TaxID=7370 RepID=A0A1I8M9E0_MUSDO|nr:protein aveugle [Musca domestica]XP_058979574.1 protein aveugle-like [Musca domestica]